MRITTDEKRELLEDVLSKMDEIADALRRIDDPQLEAYVVAEFEGGSYVGGPWLGEHSRDRIQRVLDGLGDHEGEEREAAS